MTNDSRYPLPLRQVTALQALAPWQAQVRVGSALPEAEGHTIHSYFVTCPESPDGRHLLFYTSTAPDGHVGEIRIRERATGRETVLARNVHVEDAHRAACQQWSDGGRSVVFHDYRDNRWIVVAIDVASGVERILATDRQVGFGSATDAWVPVYGCHWNPGPYRDLELIHIHTGESRFPIRIADVRSAYPDWIAREFGSRELSIFFPVISPDGERAMFKLAAGNGGDDFMSPGASHRAGKISCDLKHGRLLHQFDEWGHPSWYPDSQQIFEKGNVLVDSESGETTLCLPATQSDHPSFNPRGDLFVTDGKVLAVDHPKPAEWGIVVASPAQDAYALIHRFDNSQGAQSWRKNHPHPVFSADGRRVYFNVNEGAWTQLYVAEAGK